MAISSSPTNLAFASACSHSPVLVLYPRLTTLMVPSGFREYWAVVLLRLRSNLKSSRAISYHFPRYFSLSKGWTASTPLGMVEHENKPNIKVMLIRNRLFFINGRFLWKHLSDRFNCETQSMIPQISVYARR